MDGEAVLPDSRSKRLGFSLLSTLLAFVPVRFLLYGAVLIDTEPDVGVRPGRKERCCHRWLHTSHWLRGHLAAYHLPRRSSGGRRQPAGPGRRGRLPEGRVDLGGQRRRTVPADPGGLVRRAYRAKQRYDQGGRLVDAEHRKQQ
jgi:hypothetical protein